MSSPEQPPTDNPTAAPSGRPPARTPLIILIVLLAIVLIGGIIWAVVAASGSDTTSTASPTASATPTTAPASTAPPSTTSAATPTPSASIDPANCAVDELSVTLGESDGAAGSEYVPLQFTNTGSRTCQIEGYPGVSLVGGGNGTQIGAAATRDESVPVTDIALDPGATVVATLKVTEALNYPDCGSATADGFRVYPPHSYEAVFVKTTDFTPCTDESVELMSVSRVHNNP